MPLIYLNSGAHKASDITATVRRAIERNRDYPPPPSILLRAFRRTINLLHRFHR